MTYTFKYTPLYDWGDKIASALVSGTIYPTEYYVQNDANINGLIDLKNVVGITRAYRKDINTGEYEIDVDILDTFLMRSLEKYGTSIIKLKMAASCINNDEYKLLSFYFGVSYD